MIVPDIPENQLTNDIKKLIVACKIVEKSLFDQEGDFVFNSASTIEEINRWEAKNNINIPSSYKDWLLFSNGSVLYRSGLKFYSLDDIIIDNDKKPYNVPNEYAIIGEFISIEEVYGFSIKTGKFMIFGECEDIEEDDFGSILDWVTGVID